MFDVTTFSFYHLGKLFSTFNEAYLTSPRQQQRCICLEKERRFVNKKKGSTGLSFWSWRRLVEVKEKFFFFFRTFSDQSPWRRPMTYPVMLFHCRRSQNKADISHCGSWYRCHLPPDVRCSCQVLLFVSGTWQDVNIFSSPDCCLCAEGGFWTCDLFYFYLFGKMLTAERRSPCLPRVLCTGPFVPDSTESRVNNFVKSTVYCADGQYFSLDFGRFVEYAVGIISVLILTQESKCFIQIRPRSSCRTAWILTEFREYVEYKAPDGNGSWIVVFHV